MLWSCLPGGARDDVDAAFERVFLVGEQEIGASAAEKLGVHLLKVDAHALEGFGKQRAGRRVDLADDFEQVLLRGDEVGVLRFEELVSFFEGVVLRDGIDVDRADGVELFAQAGGEGFDARPVRRRARCFDEALIQVEEGSRLGDEELQVDLITLRGLLVQVFLAKTELRFANLLPGLAVVPAGERLTLCTQVGVDGFDEGGGGGVLVAAFGDSGLGGDEFLAGGVDPGGEVGGLGAVAFQAMLVVVQPRGGGGR